MAAAAAVAQARVREVASEVEARALLLERACSHVETTFNWSFTAQERMSACEHLQHCRQRLRRACSTLMIARSTLVLAPFSCA